MPAATVDLPTPPLQEATAMIEVTSSRPDSLTGDVRRCSGAVILTVTDSTPGRSPISRSACVLNSSRTGQAGVVM